MSLPVLNAPIHKTTLPVSLVEVTFRPFLVKEEKIMIIAEAEDSVDEIENAVSQVITNCTFGKIDPYKLCQTDLEWLLLQVRGRSKGFDVDLVFRCVNEIDKEDKDGHTHKGPCNFRNEIKSNLKTVKVVGGNESQIIQLSEDIGMKMREPTIGVLRAIEKLKLSDVDRGMAIIMASIESIYNRDEVWAAADLTREELTEFLESFTESQFNKVKDWGENSSELQLEVNFICQKCGAKDKITISGMENFFG